MNINIQKFNEVAEAAKARTSDKLWRNAIDKAVAGVVSGWWIITELHDGVMVTTECGHTYHANGSCQCKAYELGQPCKHRALARLITLYNETAPEAVSLAEVVATKAATSDETTLRCKVDRADIIADIKRLWAAKFPHDHLADALMYRFRMNYLEALADGWLQDILAAIA